MPAQTLYSVNSSAGAWTNIPATIPAHVVSIVEDGSANAGTKQGLEVQLWNIQLAQWGATLTYAPTDEPMRIYGHGVNGVVGLPAQGDTVTPRAFNYRPADNYCRVRSATATATTVRVIEQETGGLGGFDV